MADNYLEKKMEEHRRATAGGAPRRFNSLGLKPGCVSFVVPARQVLVRGYENNRGLFEAAVKAFGNAGVPTAFLCSDLKSGRDIAQRYCGRHLPLSPEDALAHIPVPDVEIAVLPAGVDMAVCSKRYSIRIADSAPEECVVNLLRYLCLPQSASLCPDNIIISEDGSVS